ncbi:MAG TPA: cytochrome C oxidase subunit II [Aliiroseovarius sp.]|nr:cytochrome C oxidase subunit II [Aliiroseovarius sp.]
MGFHIDKLEKRWIFMVAGIVALAWGIQIYYAAKGWHPPSNVEVIDSAQLHLASGVGGDEFSEANIGVKRDEDGLIVVTMVAARYGFYPQEITLPQGEPFKLRIASFDVLHGIYVPMSNLNLMLVPGYISEVTTTLNNLGEYPMMCQDFCGLGHAYMFGNVQVVPKQDFTL